MDSHAPSASRDWRGLHLKIRRREELLWVICPWLWRDTPKYWKTVSIRQDVFRKNNRGSSIGALYSSPRQIDCLHFNNYIRDFNIIIFFIFFPYYKRSVWICNIKNVSWNLQYKGILVKYRFFYKWVFRDPDFLDNISFWSNMKL